MFGFSNVVRTVALTSLLTSNKTSNKRKVEEESIVTHKQPNMEGAATTETGRSKKTGRKPKPDDRREPTGYVGSVPGCATCTPVELCQWCLGCQMQQDSATECSFSKQVRISVNSARKYVDLIETQMKLVEYDETWLQNLEDATRFIMSHGENLLRDTKLVREVLIRTANVLEEKEKEEEIYKKRKRTWLKDEKEGDDG
jgi:hypothetical protein